MSRTTLGVTALITGALVWVAAAPLAWPARGLVVLLLAVLPVVLLVQARLSADEIAALPRMGAYLSSAIAIWVLAGITALVATFSGFDRTELGIVALDPLGLGLWSLAVTAVGVAAMAVARLLNVLESPLLLHLLPRTRAEKLGFVGLSLTAGIGEELVYRGFLIPALTVGTGSDWLAIGLSAGAFGLVHSYQRADGILRATALGLVLSVPFVVTGSLLPSMIAHAALDVLGGLVLAKWLTS